eukprot:CAMPEP_0201914810 /NCGR_PEP_ID=MMETSP0903-20130614/4895_1 /ASSEMBLY_ACC=CAM_ASM_000552 /TAXON_ID=420261 /ORGANISM="Thalassiosira antarctica, Strain CCMP982" /LENGTH=639 /DNA_ID=CAMNT_0048450269 /DNA_START=62 /DNA_END=1981 /DNA_ORIENTATION=+
MTSDNILAQVGLLGDREKKNGDNGEGKNDNDVAIKALRNLIESGKVSIEDAKVAVQSAHGSKKATTAEALSNKNGSNGNNDKKKNKQEVGKPKTQETYRTRHLAIQFSYDGTDFSGFAENVGKEYDNSVEKALFGALEKARLLVSPEENGMLVINEDEEMMDVNQNEKGYVKKLVKGSRNYQLTVRTASQYSRCGRKVWSTGGDMDGTASGDLLEEASLPKNSLDGLECLVPPKKPKGDDTAQSLQIKTITEYDYPKILNNILPPAIRILGWCPVSPQFSARFSCSRRTYRYFFPRRTLDLSAMAQGLQYMMGRHDFRNLCKMNCEQVSNFERVLVSGKVVSPQKVFAVSMEDEEKSSPSIQEVDDAPQSSPHDMCHVEIEGQAFLWHQIRCILSILFHIGRQQESPTLVQQLVDIQTNPGKPSYDMASETALVLQDCKFGHLDLGRTVRNLWDVTKVLEQRWENHAVAAERANDALESVKKETEVRWTDVMEFVEQVSGTRRRKEEKREKREIIDEGEIRRELEKRAPKTSMISWASAVEVIRDVLGVYPHKPNGCNQGHKGHSESSVHVPLMGRSKGSTYEEKVQSILREGDSTHGDNGRSSKRKHRYTENIIKKKKTAEEDKAFYDHMLSQGGSNL